MQYFTSIGILFLNIFTIVNCSEWNTPKFEHPGLESIKFRLSSNMLGITMDEELELPIKLAIINYKGLISPEIGDFQVGNNDLLKAKVERDEKENNGKWILWVNTRQDYENEAQRNYQFSIKIGNEKIIIFIALLNIFDVRPTISYDGPCQAKELHANFDTKCVFTVTALDGLDKNKITLELNGIIEINDIFKFHKGDQIDDYRVPYTLFVTKELRYEDRTFYSFTTTVFDIARNNYSLPTFVEIEDIPSLNPFWVQIFSSTSILEKTNRTFQVKALDGDTGLNKSICYKLHFNEPAYSSLMWVEQENGTLHINEIDRDYWDQQVFEFSFWAYKCYNETWGIESPAVIMVEDIDDHLPEFQISPKKLRFLEEKFDVDLFNKFIINDLDIGDHATYSVSISQKGTILYSSAFDIIPNTGYKEANFKLAITNASLLDYEDPVWRSFTLILTAQEIKYPENKTQVVIPIELINWNDEKPIFSESSSVNINETIEANKFIALVRATDRDVGDRVIHEIVGNMSTIEITENGTISTVGENAFDYEQQTTVIIQIKATDTLVTEINEKPNSAFTQLTINVNDINDETPEIQMPRGTLNITENSPANTIITDNILATDKDTTANLTIEIDWNRSYATKYGKEASKNEFENCFIIDLQPITNRKVYGNLIVNPAFEKDIDYEMYDVLYLFIIVTDHNQVVRDNSTSGILAVHVDDVNDNAPSFKGDTLITLRSVVEEALPNSTVGTIFAEDIDGSEYNRIQFKIQPNDSSTPDGLISIDESIGSLKVAENVKIDCDDPKITFLNYTIIITDGELYDYGRIQIKIIDINNKNPMIEHFENPVSIYENATTGELVGRIKASDMDRDKPHNLLQYMLDNTRPELRKFFIINITTGEINVKLQDEELDRDNGILEYNINVNIEDNYNGNGRINHNSTTLNVILLDVNDNAPEMPTPKVFQPNITENSKEGTIISRLIAPDKDEYDTPNSWVSYKIISINPGSNHAENIPDPTNLFNIIGDDKVYGDLIASKSLKGYYGTWLINIEAYDHGDEGDSREIQRSNETYSISIEPYNFVNPRIIYPIDGRPLRLRFEKQQINQALYCVDGSELPLFETEDSDGGKWGDVVFELSQSPDMKYFKINKISRHTSRLEIQENIEPRSYILNIVAVDGGLKKSEEITVNVLFVDMKSEPVFAIKTFTTDFTENELGLTEKRLIPEAFDAKNEGVENENDKWSVYYFIDKNFYPEEAKLFTLDKITRILRLNEELDRETISVHQIRIFTTNQIVPEENIIHNENSTILIEILVNDVNDNPPVFQIRKYGNGITATDNEGKAIVTVIATDRDFNDSLRYVFDVNSIVAVGENIENFKTKIFKFDETSGLISLRTPPKLSMKGYFEFPISVFDEVNHTDTCNVKIYIIAESNRVSFIFLSNETQIENNKDFITSTLQEIYGYDECYIDAIKPYYYESKDIPLNNTENNELTNAIVNFIQNKEAVEAIEIQRRSNDLNFISKLKNSLLKKYLMLHDVPINPTEETSENMANLLNTVLITVSVVLGILCVVLIIAFVLKTRTLNRQIRAFEPPNFGSVSSNLNRVGAPTTNIFSVEGSNPVLNNNAFKKNTFDDTISVDSYESDFVGINNDTIFMDNDRKDPIYPTSLTDSEHNYMDMLQDSSRFYKNDNK